MGEAKRRGSLENRIIEAKIISAKKAKEAIEKRLIEEASLTPEQRRERKKIGLLFGTALAMYSGLNRR